MGTKEQSVNKSPQGKKYTSLGTSLTLWFLSLSLIPLTMISLFGYYQAKENLTRAAEERLEQSAAMSVRFISSWFSYRLMDLNVQAESQSNSKLLRNLSEGMNKSGKNSTEYVKSYDWVKRVDTASNHLNVLSRQYDYIYDIFLIDKNGNILFSVANEDDLGTSLLNGVYSNTNFSKAYRHTINTGRISFSGLERYAASKDKLAGFITAPLLNELGESIGVFAIQLTVDKIFDSLHLTYEESSSLKHYLVAEDGYLHTPLNRGGWSEVLKRKIDTQQFKLWIKEHGAHASEQDNMHEEAFEYMGPDNKKVIGIHQMLKVVDAKWLLISEIDSDEALASAQWLGKLTLLMVLLTALMVILISIYLARRIIRPIISLAEISMQVAGGDEDQHVSIDSDDEIGKLADSFNHMLEMRNLHEHEIQKTSKEAQKALGDLNEQKFALDQHAIVAITDVKGTITFVNKKFSEISGYSRDELLGKNHRILNSGYHDTNFFKDMYQTISKGNVWHGEICNKNKDGGLYWVDTTIVPFRNEQGKPKSYIAIRADITQRKAAEKELISAKDAALQAASAKSEFLASMSHEIRTPMNGVLGMLGLLFNTKLNKEQEHRVKVAQNSAQSLLTLINDILDFSKVDAGKLELEMLDFNLRGMLGDFAEAMAYQAHAKDVELVLDVTGIHESIVKGDPGRVRQILTNLVGNAIKFTRHGEIVIRVSVVAGVDNKLQMNCSISDTGIGVPVENIETLFESFSQVDASTTRKFGGTGLGLAIAKKLCLLMGGDIEVDSEVGKGSQFKFFLMLEKSVKSQLVLPKVDISKLNLLVVDDNETNREVLRGQLEHWGASVTEAMDAKQALQMCEQQLMNNENSIFDIAFLNMQMPEMDGEQLGKEIRKNKKYNNMKLVMMTSMGLQGETQHYADIGFSAYFPKPATTSDLFDALSIVAEDGNALHQASPLVTHDYLQTLVHEEEPTEISWPDNTRLLLVEDNQVNQLVAQGILKGFNLQADIAANGLEALDCLRRSVSDTPYTLVLMDCQMPEMDGYEASRAIRDGKAGEENKSIPILAMTANVMQGDRERCLDSGMDDYLSKPISPETLLPKLRQLIKA